MKVVLRKIGENLGIIFSERHVKTLGLKVGDRIEVTIQEGPSTFETQKNRPRYSLEELISESQETSLRDKEFVDWSLSFPVGNEYW
jgi:antitoxin component of MazEF toxin-antitoxin module